MFRLTLDSVRRALRLSDRRSAAVRETDTQLVRVNVDSPEYRAMRRATIVDDAMLRDTSRLVEVGHLFNGFDSE